MMGKIIAGFLVVTVVGFFLTTVYIIQFSPGREYNKNLTIELLKPKENLNKIRNYFYERKHDLEAVSVDEINRLAGEYQFLYFPKHINDPRLPLIITPVESHGKFQKLNGEFEEYELGVGFLVLYGNKFEVKKHLPDKISQVLNLIVEPNKPAEIAPEYLKNGEAILIGKTKG